MAVQLAATLAFPAAAHSQGWTGGVIHTVEVPAPSLRGNLLGDAAVRATSIYLPPSYSRERNRRYPVLYLLHGFGADNTAFIAGHYQDLNIRVSMDELIRAGKVKEMIVVTPSARNGHDGSFYANSPVTGNWEDFIVRDLVEYVDTHYRTKATRDARGVAGHSVGGHGALRLAMRHPEIFSAVYAMSPYGIGIDRAPTPATERAWMTAISISDASQIPKAGFNADLLLAETSTYSPDIAKPPLFVDFPFRVAEGQLVPDSAVFARWNVPLREVARYAPNLRRERVGFDAGRSDAFTRIPLDVAALDSALSALAIPHFTELYDGNHGNRIHARLEQIVLPFFSATFSDLTSRRSH
ncbi:MAG: alpha/beta fold hydrolase [Gemmatimonadota bacterium]|nr:alpha/beta fold hydrolase [Gemmatimonadota bacterium]